MTTFYGKYKGTVTDNKDPMGLGRIRAKVPDVMGDLESGWAMPCAPFSGSRMGFFALPDVGAGVWIEFEQGNPERPIWAGCWWGSAAEVPPILLAPPLTANMKVLIKTKGGNSILLDDTPGIGGITLETPSGQKIVMTATGVEITYGPSATIKLGPTGVSINNGALDII